MITLQYLRDTKQDALVDRFHCSSLMALGTSSVSYLMRLLSSSIDITCYLLSANFWLGVVVEEYLKCQLEPIILGTKKSIPEVILSSRSVALDHGDDDDGQGGASEIQSAGEGST